jgi:hypothetical protein
VSVVDEHGVRRLLRGIRGQRVIRVGRSDSDDWMRVSTPLRRADAQALMEVAAVRAGLHRYVLTEAERDALLRERPSLRAHLASHPPGAAEAANGHQLRVWFETDLPGQPCASYAYQEIALTQGEAPVVGPPHSVVVDCGSAAPDSP